MKKLLYLVTIILIVFILSACASVVSIQRPNLEASDGLTYFMPKKDFLIKVSVKDSKITSVEGTVTEAYPDFSEQYVLKYKFNPFGENELDLGINDKGLLTSAKAKTISKVNEALENLAKSTGAIVSMGFVPDMVPCNQDGSYAFIFDKPVTNASVCGMNVEITPIDENNYNNIVKLNPHIPNPLSDNNIEQSGIYYRQNVPYRIKVTKADLSINQEFLVFSPSFSKTHFLPISKTFFADNEIDFGFTDGMPTKYLQKTKSELVQLFKLPGSLIGGFIDGATGSLTKLVGLSAQETDLVNKSSLGELAKYRHEKCLAALSAKNDDLINQFCK
ncbi:MAG: hypothetical protein AAB293_04845 [Pseudomonadota bacterium]